MGLLDQITTKDIKIDSAEILATDVDLEKDKEYGYKYWLFTTFDYQYRYNGGHEERFRDCFINCPQIHNFEVEYLEESSRDVPSYLSNDVKFPTIRVMFNLKHNNTTCVVRFLNRLFTFLEKHINKGWRANNGVRSVIIADWRTETYRKYMRYDFSRYSNISNFLDNDCIKDNILKPFNVDLSADIDKIEKLTLWNNNRNFLHRLHTKSIKKLKITANYAVQSMMMPCAKPDIIPIEIFGDTYTELIVRMIYIECVGYEQNTEPNFDPNDYYYDGWKYMMFQPMPQLGENAYPGGLYNKNSNVYRSAYDEYSQACKTLMQMSKHYEGNDIDSFALRMALPNVIGRMAKKCKSQGDPEHIAMELFFKANTLNVDAVLKKAKGKRKKINKLVR